MSKLLLLLFLSIITCGCAPRYYGVCRHSSIYESAVYGDFSGCEVLIARGVRPDGKKHAQAVAKCPDGTMQWINHVGAYPSVKKGDKDNFRVTSYIKPTEYLKLILNQGD